MTHAKRSNYSADPIVLAAIVALCDRSTLPTTTLEIAGETGCSRSLVQAAKARLAERGLVTFAPRIARTIKPTAAGREAVRHGNV